MLWISGMEDCSKVSMYLNCITTSETWLIWCCLLLAQWPAGGPLDGQTGAYIVLPKRCACVLLRFVSLLIRSN